MIFVDHHYLAKGNWKRPVQVQKGDGLCYEQLQDRNLAYSTTKGQLRIFSGFPTPYLSL